MMPRKSPLEKEDVGLRERGPARQGKVKAGLRQVISKVRGLLCFLVFET